MNKRAREQPSSASGSGSKGGDAAPPVKKARKSLGDERVFGKEGRRVYCDGSSRGNGQKGAVAGIGVFWSHEVGAP